MYNRLVEPVSLNLGSPIAEKNLDGSNLGSTKRCSSLGNHQL